MVLIVFFSSRISPRTSTVIFAKDSSHIAMTGIRKPWLYSSWAVQRRNSSPEAAAKSDAGNKEGGGRKQAEIDHARWR